MRLSRLTGVAIALLVAAGCAGQRASYDYDEAVDFAKYRRWAWSGKQQEQPSGAPLVDNPLTRQRIESAIARTLAAKGFEKSEREAADFEVGYAVMVDKKLGAGGVSTTFGFGRYGGGSGIGISVGGPRTRVREHEEGTLVIDVRDDESEKLVWRGSSKSRIGESRGPEQSEQEINRIVSEILANFPPEPRG